MGSDKSVFVSREGQSRHFPPSNVWPHRSRSLRVQSRTIDDPARVGEKLVRSERGGKVDFSGLSSITAGPWGTAVSRLGSPKPRVDPAQNRDPSLSHTRVLTSRSGGGHLESTPIPVNCAQVKKAETSLYQSQRGKR